MKDAFWFPHYSNARRDPKILALRAEYGAKGYGWFWILLEMMRDQSNYKLARKTIRTACRMEMGCSANTAEKFVSQCIEDFQLFASDEEFFWSERLLTAMAQKDAKSELGRKAANKRWSNNKDVVGKASTSLGISATQTHSSSNAGALQEEEKKEQESKEYKNIIREEEIREDHNLLLSQLPSEFNDPTSNKAIHDWIHYREEIGKPLTTSTLEKLGEEWKGRPEEFAVAVNRSICAGWVGLRDSGSPSGKKSNFEKNTELILTLEKEDHEQS